MIYNVLVVLYNNKYIFDFSDFLLPETPGATYMIHMTNSLNYCIFFCLLMTKSLLFYDQINFFLMWCILRLSRVKQSQQQKKSEKKMNKSINQLNQNNQENQINT